MSAAGLESSNQQVINMSVDLLGAVWTSANFAAAVAARYSTIRIKGYSITRTLLSIDMTGAAVPIPVEYPFIHFCWRIDNDIAYSAVTGADPTTMLQCQDIKYKVLPLSNAGTTIPLVVEAKIFARPEQLYTLDTAIAPAAAGNTEYWDACFSWGCQIGVAAGVNMTLDYRDVIEILYDGFERK